MRRNRGPLVAAAVIAAVPVVTLAWQQAWSSIWLIVLQAGLASAGIAILRRERRGYGLLPEAASTVDAVERVTFRGRRRDRGEWLTAHRNFQGRTRELAGILSYHDEQRRAVGS